MLQRIGILFVLPAFLYGCVNRPEIPYTEAVKVWDTDQELDVIAGCINTAFRNATAENGGYSTAIEKVVPNQEYRISQTGRRFGVLSNAAPKSFLVTLKKQEIGTQIEYRAYNNRQRSDHKIIDSCL
jgi:hypothetical protein